MRIRTYLYKCPWCGRYFVSKTSDQETIECPDCGSDIKYSTCMGIVGGISEPEWEGEE